MDTFIPFIHEEKEKEEFEQLPLYIDEAAPIIIDEDDEDEDDRGVIILDIL